MEYTFKRFIVGTKERPATFLMYGGEPTEYPEYAEMFETEFDANEEIGKCDEPEKFKLFNVNATVEDL